MEPRMRKSKDERRAQAEARNRLYRGTRDARRRLGAVEKEMADAQAAHDGLLEVLADTELYQDKDRFSAAMAEYASAKGRLTALEEEWIALSEQIERLEAQEGAGGAEQR